MSRTTYHRQGTAEGREAAERAPDVGEERGSMPSVLSIWGKAARNMKDSGVRFDVIML
jgi:hypothetical protein